MEIIKKNWVDNPSKKTIIIASIICFVGSVLLVSAVTNLFREDLSQLKNGVVILLMGFSFFTIAKLYNNYKAN